MTYHETFREATLGVTVAAQGTDFTGEDLLIIVQFFFYLFSPNAMLGSLPRG